MAADGPAGMPSEAELEQMLAQMREAPAEQVLVEVVNVLLQAAQVKLGRPDARLLIDAVAAVADAAAGRADAALLGQVGQAVAQLRLAQVEAEGGAGGAVPDAGPASRGSVPTGGAPGAPSGPTPGAPGAPGAPSAGGAPGGAQTSRLWVPGR
jgi:hypothetical protein